MSFCTQRCADEVVSFISMWDIGASGAHTKTAGVPGTGFASVAETAAGKYTITFANDTLPNGPLVDLRITVHQATDEESWVPRPTVSSYVPQAGVTNPTAKYENWVIDETAAQTELPSGAKVTIEAKFMKTKAF